MKNIYTDLALYGRKNECVRNDAVFLPISQVCDGTVSLRMYVLVLSCWFSNTSPLSGSNIKLLYTLKHFGIFFLLFFSVKLVYLDNFTTNGPNDFFIASLKRLYHLYYEWFLIGTN